MIRLAVFILMLMSGPVWACEVPDGLQTLRADLLVRSNSERTAAGVLPLTRDARLDAAAQTHACRIARRGRLTHRGSWFAGLGRRLRREDYPYAMAAENLADGHLGPEAVTRGWMDSPEHRVNTLDPRARHAGFGVAVARDGRLHWTMIVAAPRQD